MSKNDPMNVIAPRCGFKIIGDTADHTGSWDSIVVLTDCVFTTLEENDILLNGVAVNALQTSKTNIVTNSTTIPAGAILIPENDIWSKIKLQSGQVQAFKS